MNFYRLLFLGILLCQVGCSFKYIRHSASSVVTVTGAKPVKDMGVTLIHEHVLVDFIGADKVSPDRYNPDEVFTVVLPHLQSLKALGIKTLVECTPAFLGRDPLLLKRLSEASGLSILTNTGLYGAGKGKYLPAYAFTETVEQLANRWITESKQGIAHTGIKPGFIKISVDAGALTPINKKIVQAAALTHLQTGLTIASHTGNGEAALEEIELIRKNGVEPDAFIWVHAQNEKDINYHIKAGKAGAWLSFDGISLNNFQEYINQLQHLKEAGLLNRVLISQDAGWYHVGETNGGDFRSYTTLLTDFLPKLKSAGFTLQEINLLLSENPKKAFQI